MMMLKPLNGTMVGSTAPGFNAMVIICSLSAMYQEIWFSQYSTYSLDEWINNSTRSLCGLMKKSFSSLCESGSLVFWWREIVLKLKIYIVDITAEEVAVTYTFCSGRPRHLSKPARAKEEDKTYQTRFLYLYCLSTHSIRSLLFLRLFYIHSIANLLSQILRHNKSKLSGWNCMQLLIANHLTT